MEIEEHNVSRLLVADEMKQYIADQIYSIDLGGDTQFVDVVRLALYEVMEFERITGTTVTDYLQTEYSDKVASPAKWEAQFPEYTPCGGCGASNPNDRCINCGHVF